MPSLAEYIQRVHSKYPSDFPPLDPLPFPKKENPHAPTLLKNQTNRILIYRGSFSPPHIGHLTLLQHAFSHGGRDLNIIAAIIKPVDGATRPARAKCSDRVLAFSREERIALWKGDERVPAWAWVFEASMAELRKMLFCMKEVAEGDGCRLEFVALYGPDNAGWREVPCRHHRGAVVLGGGDEGVGRKEVFAGCEVTMICDAGRRAGEFDRGRLERFVGCGKWRRLVVDVGVLVREEREKAESVVGLLREMQGSEYQGLVSQAGSEAAAIGEMAKCSVTEAVRDNQHIVVCRAKHDKGLQIRFVRRDRSEPGFKVEVSGTILRKAIETEEGEKLRESVEAMALSPRSLLEMMGVDVGARDRDDGGRLVEQSCLETCSRSAGRGEEPIGV